MTEQQKQPFFCIKLKSGETLLSEVVATDGTMMHLKEPFLIEGESQNKNEASVMMMALPWVPFIDTNVVKIPMNHVYFFEYLNDRYKKFYGTILLQHKISSIKQEVEDEMDGVYDYTKMRLGVDRIKEVTSELCDKFGLENTVDTSAFDNKLEEYKGKMH